MAKTKIEKEMEALDLDVLFEEAAGTALTARPAMYPRVIALGSGAGGVGKTVVSILLGILLSNKGEKAIIIDSDFAGTNLFSKLCLRNPEKSLRHFIEQTAPDINDVAQKTPFENLRVITGTPGLASYTQITYAAKQKLLQNLRKLDAPIVIIDLGAGGTYTNIDLFLRADDAVIVTTYEARALYESYVFLRVALFRKLQKSARNWPDLYDQFTTCGHLTKKKEIKTIPAFLEANEAEYPIVCEYIRQEMDSLHPRLIVNEVHKKDDRKRLQLLLQITKSVLGIELAIWGEIRHDLAVRDAVAKSRLDQLSSVKVMEDIRRIAGNQLLIPHTTHTPTTR